MRMKLIATIMAASMVTNGYIGFGGLCVYDGNHTRKEQREYNDSGENPASCIGLRWNEEDETYSFVLRDDD